MIPLKTLALQKLNLLRTSFRCSVCLLSQRGNSFISILKTRARRRLIRILSFLIQMLTEWYAWLERSEVYDQPYVLDRSLRLPDRALHTHYRRHKGLFED